LKFLKRRCQHDERTDKRRIPFGLYGAVLLPKGKGETRMQESKITPKFGTFVEAWGQLAQQLKFLSGAVSSDETRYFMNFIYIELSELPATTEDGTVILKGIATDGHRLHIVDPLPVFASQMGLESGFWKVIKNNSKTFQMAKMREGPGEFPNYKKVIPKDEPRYETEYWSDGCKIQEKSFRLVKFFRDFPKLTVINLEYLAALTPGEIWKVRWIEERKAITFTANTKTAIIMPIDPTVFD
jgi:hypothetical protein